MSLMSSELASVARATEANSELIRLTFGLRRREGVERRHGVVHPLEEQLYVTCDVALSLVALLELVPFPDRFMVRQGPEVDGELTCVAAMA